MENHSATISRRSLLLGLGALVSTRVALAEPINPGRFKTFVDDRRLDPEIAHVLQVLDSYPPGSWSHETAAFAHASLTSRDLLGIAKASTATTLIEPQMFPDHPGSVGLLGDTIREVQSGTHAFTTNLRTPPSVVSFTVIEDARVTAAATQPGEARERLARTLVHELNHVRNRNQIQFMKMDTAPAVALFVDEALARSEGGQLAMADFAAELATSHATWRCVKEWDAKWRGIPVPTSVRPRGLWRFALEQADQNRAPGLYLQTLRERGPAVYGRQVATWMSTMRSFTFVSQIPVNIEVANLFDSTAAAAALTGFDRPRDSIDGGLNYWNASR